jgi:UDP-N-acetylmuramate dehydrogenase
MDLLKKLKGKIRFNEPLSRHTSFKIGGRAYIFFEPKDIKDLVQSLSVIKRHKIPYFLIGNGSNLLIKDADFPGIVIRLSSPYFRQMNIKGNIITVGAGHSISNLVKVLSKTDLGGYEFLSGIPGSMAGALVMNAGTNIDNKNQSISDIAQKIRVLDKNGKVFTLAKKDINFRYRDSSLNKYIILQAQLKLDKNKETKGKDKIRELLSHRRKYHDYSKPNAGCIFKNPSEDISAGKLIDSLGLKGLRVGGAMISQKHANFILNFNRATAKDVVELINIIKKKVRDRYRINLREEIKIVS